MRGGNQQRVAAGLTDGVNAVSITTFDNSRYNGTTTGTANDLRTAINTDSNWTGSNTPLSPHGVASFTVSAGPETQTVVFNPVSVTHDEGNSGDTIYTFTVTRTGGTTGQLNFSGTIAAGTTDAPIHRRSRRRSQRLDRRRRDQRDLHGQRRRRHDHREQ